MHSALYTGTPPVPPRTSCALRAPQAHRKYRAAIGGKEAAVKMNESEPIGRIFKLINDTFKKDSNFKLKESGITGSQCAVLMFLFSTTKKEVNQRDIEAHLKLKNPTVTGILKRMEEKGFIQCVVNHADKRFKNVFLTPKAQIIEKNLRENMDCMDQLLVKNMSEQEIQTLRILLYKVLENISENGSPL
jgi:DNA-binding MarR family transcriptional regulator